MRRKKTIYNIAASLILQFIILISGFIVPKLIIKSYGSDVNGLLSSITQFLSYIALLQSGIGPVVRAALYKPIANKNKQEIENILKSSERFFRIIALIFIVYLIGLSIIYPILVQNEFEYIYTLSLILIISIGTFFEYYFGITYSLYLHALQKQYITSLIQIISYILNIFAVVILIKLNANIQTVKFVSCIIFLLKPMLQNIYVKKKYKINLKNADKNYKLDKKWDGLAQHVAAIVHNSTDVTILTIFSKLSEVSVYSVYHLVEKGVKSIVSSFTSGIDALFGDMLAKKENTKLNKSFELYEVIYFIVITIIYISTSLLIVPFIKVYTYGIDDANYIRPLFGFLLVLSGFVGSIRLPYSSITLAAGHFKETKKGAWLEAILNIVISITLVIKFGLIGVVIGTLVSTLIRTIEFMYHTNKYILEINIIKSIKKILIIVVEFIIIILITNFISLEYINSYLSWIVYAIIIFLLTSLITLSINYIVYKKEFKELFKIVKNIRK